jgi:hypothetical protein
MEETDEEIWKPITDFPNYEISSKGQVKSNYKNIIMKLQKNYAGYLNISLISFTNDIRKSVSCKAHRLVAKEFIDNTENKPTVDHIDKNKQNNCVTNLRWATYKEQTIHVNKGIKFFKPINYRPVYRINNETNEIIELYKSIAEAALWIIDNKLTSIKDKDKNNISIISSKICAVGNNKRPIAYGFKWQYFYEKKDENEIWKEIPFEIVGKNNYYVSTKGSFKNNKNVIINDHKYNSGYKRIYINNKSYSLHRLVALTFLENPENKEAVNHIDGNKLNNELTNLEWATCLENNMHKIQTGLSNCTQKVMQYDKNMNKLNEFYSIVECSEFLNISASCVSDNCRGKTQVTKCGFLFRYAE